MTLKPIFPSCSPEEWEGPTLMGGHIDGYGGTWSLPHNCPQPPPPRITTTTRVHVVRSSPRSTGTDLTLSGSAPPRVGSGLRLGMTAYIDDVDEHGGCFTYWPTGHTSHGR
jgi:hypothetical protein